MRTLKSHNEELINFKINTKTHDHKIKRQFFGGGAN